MIHSGIVRNFKPENDSKQIAYESKKRKGFIKHEGMNRI